MKIKDQSVYRGLLFLIALVGSGILFFAALAKILYPSPSLASMEHWIGFAEVCLASALLVYYPYPLVWAVAGSVFSAWAGYAFFWIVQGLPCGCLGSIVDIAPSLALMFDLVFWGIAWAMLTIEKSSWLLKKYLFLSLFLVLFGFLFGFIVNNYFIEV